MSDCKHEAFEAKTAVARIGDDGGPIQNFVAEIQISCKQCGSPFHFLGPSAGFSFARPTVNVGATTLHAPIAPGEGPIPAGMRFEMPKRST